MSINVNYIPAGPLNLSAIFPAIDFSDIAEYNVQALDDSNNVLATSPIYEMSSCNGTNGLIVFLNFLGVYESVMVSIQARELDVQSQSYEKGLPEVFSKSATGQERFAVVASEYFTAKSIGLTESEMQWAMELVSSPDAFMVQSPEDGQSADLIPIIIVDTKLVKKKADKQYSYDFMFDFKLANDKIIIRN